MRRGDVYSLKRSQVEAYKHSPGKILPQKYMIFFQ